MAEEAAPSKQQLGEKSNKENGEQQKNNASAMSFEDFVHQSRNVLCEHFGIVIGSAGTPTPDSVNFLIEMLRMSRQQTIDENVRQFTDCMLSFITQCVVGMIVAKYRGFVDGKYAINTIQYLMETEINQQTMPLLQLAAKYINICWHSYGKKDDQFIENTIKTLINSSKLKNNTCTFHWIWTFIKVLHDIVLNNIKQCQYPEVIINNTNEYRAYIKTLVTFDSESLREIIAKTWKTIECEEGCKDEYDGSDFFTMQVSQEKQEKNEEEKNNDNNDNDDNNNDQHNNDNDNNND